MSPRIRILIAFVGTVGLGIVLGNLSYAAHFPDAYGFDCNRAGCALAFPWHSIALLRHGGSSEALLFVAIWALTAWIIAIPFWISPRKPISTSSISE